MSRKDVKETTGMMTGWRCGGRVEVMGKFQLKLGLWYSTIYKLYCMSDAE